MNKIRYGSALEHGKAHQKEHNNWSRRSFLRGLGMAGGASMLFGANPLSALAASPFGFALNSSNSDRILVLIRLKGGNDGLNTVIPLFDYGTYIANRPNIGIPQNEVVGLNDSFGLHPQMNDLMPLWNEDKMKIIHSVGYPDQNLSHFRSSDIWGSASDADMTDTSGWLGRFITNQYPDYLTNPPEIPPAIQIGGTGSIIFNDTEQNNLSVSVRDPNELFEIAQSGQLYPLDNLPDCFYGEQLEFMRINANATFIYAEAIKAAYDSSTTDGDYLNGMNSQLSLVARLIKGNLGTKLYMVTVDGFDTHANQPNQHANLLYQISNTLPVFFQDLAAANKDQDVLVMTVSEFGRRIGQNASNGTDHGSAAPLMMFGAGLNGSGFVGTPPDLQNTDANGNLAFHTDFREIYATVLENWLCIDPQAVDMVLGQSFNRLDVGLDCMAVNTAPKIEELIGIQHEARYDASGRVVIHYNLPRAANIKVDVFDIIGQHVAQLHNGYQMAGTYQIPFVPPRFSFVNGIYVYRIEVEGRVYSRKMQLMR